MCILPRGYPLVTERVLRMTTDMHVRVANDFGFHPANDITRPLHQATRTRFRRLAEWIVEHTPASREQSLALTALQEAAMWTNAAIAVNLAPLAGPNGRTAAQITGTAYLSPEERAWYLAQEKTSG